MLANQYTQKWAEEGFLFIRVPTGQVKRISFQSIDHSKHLGDLQDQVAMQISYSIYKTGNPDMALRNSDAVWFERFAEARLESIRGVQREDSEFYAGGIPMPEAHVIEAMKGQYTPNHA